MTDWNDWIRIKGSVVEVFTMSFQARPIDKPFEFISFTIANRTKISIAGMNWKKMLFHLLLRCIILFAYANKFCNNFHFLFSFNWYFNSFTIVIVSNYNRTIFWFCFLVTLIFLSMCLQSRWSSTTILKYEKKFFTFSIVKLLYLESSSAF